MWSTVGKVDVNSVHKESPSDLVQMFCESKKKKTSFQGISVYTYYMYLGHKTQCTCLWFISGHVIHSSSCYRPGHVLDQSSGVNVWWSRDGSSRAGMLSCPNPQLVDTKSSAASVCALVLSHTIMKRDWGLNSTWCEQTRSISVPDPTPPPIRITFSIAHYTGTNVRTRWGLGTRLERWLLQCTIKL